MPRPRKCFGASPDGTSPPTNSTTRRSASYRRNASSTSWPDGRPKKILSRTGFSPRLSPMIPQPRSVASGWVIWWRNTIAREVGILERLPIISGRIKGAQRPEFRIDRDHFRLLHPPCAHGVEEKNRPQLVLCQQRFHVRQNTPAVDRGKRVGEAVDLHYGDVVIAK